MGRLAQKIEPAGKVRIFAIVDGWTQSILRPLHDFLFDVLRNIPQDGTFDQYGPLQLLVAKNLPFLGSYDLSAATDRLPIDLQRDILGFLFGDTFAKSWVTLLVGRDYYFKGDNYRYAVGQPMGALSSWAMLALTHHIIIQTAAQRTGRYTSWFEDYAVLGDDVVIGCEHVSHAYLKLMSDLGVSINMTKSVISRTGSLEFAKRTIIEGVDLSPYGPRAILQSVNAPSLSLPLIMEVLRREGRDNHPEILKIFTNLPKRWGRYRGIY